jgi:Terpene synthase family 2, C-terminal metal binding
LRKELARNDVHNLVLVMQAGLDCKLNEATARVQDMTEARMAAYIQGRRQVEHILDSSTLPAARRDDVRRVLRIYEDWMSGHYQWGKETGRYADIVYTSPGATPHYIEQLLTVRTA